MSTQSTRVQGDKLLAFFGLTFAITWGLAILFVIFTAQIEAIFGELSLFNPLFILAVAGPTIAATILTFRQDGVRGLKTLYSRLVHWRVGVRWYALVLIGVPAVGYVVAKMAGPEVVEDLNTPSQLFMFLLALLITGPLGEELGWRGFALPRLLNRFNPLLASLILGIIWGVWHLPSFFLSGTPQTGLAIPTFLFAAICLAVIATWLYLHTGQSVLIIVLFHYMVNFSMSVLGAPLTEFTVSIAVAAVCVVLLDRGFGWFQRDKPAIA